MPLQRDFRLPKRRPWPWIAILASVVVHSVLLFGWVGGRLPTVPRFPRQLIVLSPPAGGHEHVPMRYQLPEAAAGRSGRELAQSRRGASRRRAVRPELPTRPGAVTVLPEKRPERAVADTGNAPRPQPAPALGRIGPGLAQGRLWVRPLPLPPRDLAQRLSRSPAELLDSAVTTIVQAYLDSIASDPATKNQGLPSWTAEIAGKKFGLDSKNIYIAGLKIPAAVLALLPIPAGNIDQNRAYNHLMDLRGDLLYAAQRAQTMEEFKTIIREMRERKEREREFEKNQRTAPPPEEPLTP
ncbi:MAG TPA: hypothetical protein VGJ36_00145 [Gemmatimonadales bacterium]